MGTTIGLNSLDRRGYFLGLRHSNLRKALRAVAESRGLIGQPIDVTPVDYGRTNILLDSDAIVRGLMVSGKSIDYGRADIEGRQATCHLFEELLHKEIVVINGEPDPRPYDQIIGK